jgi:hypothetical protein
MGLDFSDIPATSYKGLTVYPKQEHQSRMYFTRDGKFCVDFPHPMPNRWIRFWHRLFFGFRWESMDEIRARDRVQR